MNSFECARGCLGILFLFWAFLRVILRGIVSYKLNNSAYKKKKKGQGFVEWFTFCRFKTVIPKVWFVIYWCVIWMHLAGAIICFLLPIVGLKDHVGEVVLDGLVVVFCLFVIVFYLLFYSIKKRGLDYGRWIKKR